MTGQVDLCTPLSLVSRMPFSLGCTVQEHFDASGLAGQAVVCLRDGEPLLRRDWHLVVQPSWELKFIVLPQNGGGGGIGKIIRTVALVALAVVAPVIAPAIGAAIGVTSAIGISLISAGIIIGGSLLINALLPPQVPGGQGPADDLQASPTYSLSAQGNSARLLQPVPRLYGRHILFPDFASQPFTTYENNDQYLYQLFSLGVGEYDVEQVRVEDTVIWNAGTGFTSTFSDVDLEVIPPGGTVTLFPAAVITSVEVGGQELLALSGSRQVSFSGNRITYTGSDDDDNLGAVATGDVLTVSGTASNNGTFNVTGVSGDGSFIDVQQSLSSESSVSATMSTVSWVGPFVANDADRDTDQLHVDLLLPRGLYYANDEGNTSPHSISVRIEAQQVDDQGSPVGSWALLGERTYTEKTATPQRITERFTVTRGRWQVRVRRTGNKELSTRYANDIQWGGLRAFIPDDNTFADVTLMAVKMRATNQLSNQASKRFNVIQTAKLPVWNGTAWSAPTATRNPAWAAADILRNSVYGAGLADSRIDLAKLLSLSSTWAARGDNFDAVYDSKRTIWDALSACLRCGRSQPLLVAGVVTFTRDEPVTIVRGMFTPRNIVRGSFELTHLLYEEDSPDSVIVEFLDERTWEQNEVLCSLPGSTEEDPARIRIFGIVGRTHAWREGMYQSAANTYRRTFAALSTEMEGRLLLRGDAVAVAHDLPSWGSTAEVTGWDAASRQLTLSDPVEGTVVGLSDRRGQLWGPVDVSLVSDDGLTATLDATDLTAVEAAQGTIPVYTDLDQEPTRASFGTSETWSRQFKVVTARPEGLEKVQLTLSVDDDRVYSSDTGSPPAEVDGYGPGTNPDAPVLTGLFVSQDPSSPPSPVLLNASWQPAAGATQYIVQSSTDGLSWRTVYEGPATSCQFTEQAGSVYVQAAAVGSIRGPFANPDPNPQSYGTPDVLPARPSGLNVNADVTGGALSVAWSAAAWAVSYKVELRTDSVTPGTFDQVEVTRSVLGNSTLFTSSDIEALGGPWPDVLVSVRGVNTAGDGPEVTSTETGLSLDAPAAVTLTTPWTGRDLALQWTAVASATSYEVNVMQSGALRGKFTALGNSLTIPESTVQSMAGPWRSLDVEVRALSGNLRSGAATLAVSDPTPDAPTNPTTSSTTAGEVDVSWGASSGATEYVLYGSSTSGFTPVPANELYRGAATSVNISGLTTGDTLYAILAAEDDYAGGGPFNQTAEFSQLVS